MSSSRIDRIYCTPSLFLKSDTWTIHNQPLFTDHSTVSMNVSPRAQIKMGKGLWRMNTKRFDHSMFRKPVVRALKNGLAAISTMWKKDNSSFSPVPPAAGPRTLALFSEMMDEIVAVAAKAQRDIAKAMGRCVRKYQRKVRILESQRRSRGTVNKLRAAKAKLRAFELKDKG